MSIKVMIYALGGVSGAHFNPAVTTALTLAGKSPASDIPHFMASQLLGGLAAGMTSASAYSVLSENRLPWVVETSCFMFKGLADAL